MDAGLVLISWLEVQGRHLNSPGLLPNRDWIVLGQGKTDPAIQSHEETNARRRASRRVSLKSIPRAGQLFAAFNAHSFPPALPLPDASPGHLLRSRSLRNRRCSRKDATGLGFEKSARRGYFQTVAAFGRTPPIQAGRDAFHPRPILPLRRNMGTMWKSSLPERLVAANVSSLHLSRTTVLPRKRS